jgi:polyketide-type polyunsaturated fatty acid synthase PfaA
MAAMFPKARNLQEYWNNIVGKVDCITDVPPSRWKIEDYYDPDPTVPDKTYSKRGGFIPDIEFNPIEFGLPPNILEVTDIAQLLSLVVAKAAMEDAGYGESKNFSRERTGVVLGVVGGCMQLLVPLTTRLQYPIWEKVLKSSGLSNEDTQKIIEKIKLAYVGWQENSFPGWLANVVAGRIANRLNLGGINCVVDAACASSLSAVKMAISELIEGRCDLMITGGVEADNSMLTYMSFSKTPAFSKKQQCRPFDVDADGMMASEGVGMVVLKRLADAERDGDRIYAVIKGIGTSSDGRYKSIYAPRPEGQAKALRRAYLDAGFPASSVGLIEAHGTGTVAGDLCEFTALKQVFSEDNPKQQHIALGSVKSQIGHAKAAAGAASLIKTTLALHHKVLPPILNVTEPNPKFSLETSPFYLNTQTRPWLGGEPGTPRRAGVSAFGFGGTNYHVVLEEYGSERSSYRLHSVPQSILLWDQTPEQLLAKCQASLSQLQSDTGNQHYTALINSCKESVVPVTAARVGFVAVSSVEACELLQIAINQLEKQLQAASWEHPRGVYYRNMGISLQGKVVALFPGQGSQYLEMGSKLAVNFPPLRQVYSSLDDLFIQDGLQPLSQRVFPCPAFDSNQKAAQIEALQQTENAQPAIGVFSVGLYRILQQAGFKPDFVAGHSFGELTALWAAGVLSDADYFYLVKARGKAMGISHKGADCDAGAMLAVNGDIRNIQEVIRGLSHLSIANFNSPNQVVLSGAKPEIAAVQQILSKCGYSATQLPVSAAFHSRFVSHASQPFAEAVRSVTFNRPQIPVYSNTTGEPYSTEPEAIQKTLEAHLLKSVLFEQEIENLYAAGGYCFVEIGPRQILTNLVKSILRDRPHVAIALNPSREKDSDLQLRQAVMQLRVAGLPLQDLDPYQLEPVPAEVGKGSSQLNVMLGASNYVSEKTKAAFEQALQDGHRIESVVHKSDTTAAAKFIATEEVTTDNKDLTLLEPITVHTDAIACEPPERVTVETDVIPTQLVAIQSQFTPTDTASTEDLPFIIPLIESKDMLQPISQSSSGNAQHGVNTSLEKLMTQFYSHQSEILRVHEQYLKNQAECSLTFLQLMQQPSWMLAASNTKPQWLEMASEVASANGKQASLFATQADQPAAKPQTTPTVSETTAPDSSSQTHPNAFPSNAPVAEPQISSVENQSRSLTPVPANALENSAVEAESNSKELATPVTSTDTEGKVVTPQFLMQVISTKTGYPVDMLDGEMNPKADLGIDAVKWMDIVSAMQELLPDLPKVNPSELAEQPTIRQVAEYIQTRILKTSPSSQVPALSQVPTLPNAGDTVAPSPAESIETDEITQCLLSVVTDKTGYPAEMLEIQMDLEADLGIDSIKRVEIIGAMQELFPELPKLSPEELAEQRTLGKIAEYLGTQIAVAKKKCLTAA